VHNNFYFLRHLTETLGEKITNGVVSECFSQNKNELILRFEISQKSFFIKASLQTEFSCLSFPQEFNRARKNSVDLFESLIGQRVIALRQYHNERSFSIHFTEEWKLLFKMHGNKSNLVLFKNDSVKDLFRKKLTGDNSITLSSLDREIDWSFEHFLAHQQHPEKIYFTFGKVVWQYLNEKGFNQKNAEEKWNMIQDVINQLHQKKYYITELKGNIIFSLIEIGDVQKQFIDPIQAVNYFLPAFTTTDAFDKEKSNAISMLTNRLNGGLNYLVKTKQKLDQINNDDHYKRWADILMANLHAENVVQSSIQLSDFYNDNQLIDIKLKKDLSLQKNAELYYRKAKNHKLEIEYLEKAIAAKEEEVSNLQQSLSELNDASDLKTLRSKTQTLDLAKKNESAQGPLPYHEFEHNGFRIWVGRNAAANDQLTLKYSYKEDLWLHAKDVAGSHVIIKYQSGKKFPKDVVERAAQLAAYNSKRKNESLCPVIFTPKKFVRKRKGDPAGAVVVEREEVIMVEPSIG